MRVICHEIFHDIKKGLIKRAFLIWTWRESNRIKGEMRTALFYKGSCMMPYIIRKESVFYKTVLFGF